MAKPEKVENLSFGVDLWAHDDPTIDEKDPTINAYTGTRKSGYSEGKYGPFRCDNCLHYEADKKACDNTHVLKDREIRSIDDDHKKVDPAGCCWYFRNKNSKIPESAKIEAAAELPDIQGFTGKITREITKYLFQLPRRLLHYTKLVKAAPELNAVHGRYDKSTETVFINPKNFENQLKFGTKNTADIDQHVLAHEFGHGLYENLSSEQRSDWEKISGWKKGIGKGQAPPYVELRPGWPRKISEWTHAKDAKFARRYQQKSPGEDFADNVAYIATGNASDVPEEKRNFIQSCLE